MNTNKIAIGIQSTAQPPIHLSLSDWRLYLKVRDMKRLMAVRNLNNRINQVLNQSISVNGN